MHPPLPEEMPLYVFAALDEAIDRRRAAGHTVYDLTKSDPAHEPPPAALEALHRAASEPHAHLYPPFAGTSTLRRAVARWYEQRHGVSLDPDREVFILQGSKEGLVHLAQALVRPGDTVLVPDPAFPAYAAGARLAGALPVTMPLWAERHFLPDVRNAVASAPGPVRLCYLNYPNNPTGAVADRAFFADVVAEARAKGFWVCHDFAYAEIFFQDDDPAPPSFLAAPGARAVGLETISWSKTCAMQGYRLGALVGHADAIAAFARVETNVMAGSFVAVQAAGLAALEDPEGEAFAQRRREGYRRRLERLRTAFHSAGWSVPMPRATVYLWIPAPQGMDGQTFADILLEEGGVAVAPGSAFGPSGRAYVRVAATADDDVIDQAADALAKVLRRHAWPDPYRALASAQVDREPVGSGLARGDTRHVP